MRKVTPNNKLELELLESGYSYVVGVDEVGRGCWAGPVTVCAFVYTKKTLMIEGVNDSKKISLNKRTILSKILSENLHSIESIGNEQIDNMNIVEATRIAMINAVANLNLSNFIVLIDGFFKKEFPFKNQCVIKGDSKHYSIAAASILAKVERDSLMQDFAKKYPNYLFEKNVGYGTKGHIESLKSFGICPIHRRSYKPVRKYC